MRKRPTIYRATLCEFKCGCSILDTLASQLMQCIVFSAYVVDCDPVSLQQKECFYPLVPVKLQAAPMAHLEGMVVETVASVSK
ncbi:unnamed protein product [Hydatigera taeniaeformis]|uniref:Secreted protein n=1 Tax=Hydatigena taeniaeformis TaxID=6205 RepID=A0A0R3WXL7_HYDTA|nr:unnamed protein product [Hydatigera taeniaeformis]